MNSTQIFRTVFGAIAAIILIIIVVSNAPQSRSGANKVLRTNGTMEYTTIYDVDTLYFTPSHRVVPDEVLRSLNTLAYHYVVVLNDCRVVKGNHKPGRVK